LLINEPPQPNDSSWVLTASKTSNPDANQKHKKAQKFALTILILNQCRPRKLINLSWFTVTNSVSVRYTTSWEIWQQFQ
jgi:hypothetical protein